VQKPTGAGERTEGELADTDLQKLYLIAPSRTTRGGGNRLDKDSHKMISEGLRIMQQELQQKQWKHARGSTAGPAPSATRHTSNFYPSSLPKVRFLLCASFYTFLAHLKLQIDSTHVLASTEVVGTVLVSTHVLVSTRPGVLSYLIKAMLGRIAGHAV
jgi:hypothetical protein